MNFDLKQGAELIFESCEWDCQPLLEAGGGRCQKLLEEGARLRRMVSMHSSNL